MIVCYIKHRSSQVPYVSRYENNVSHIWLVWSATYLFFFLLLFSFDKVCTLGPAYPEVSIVLQITYRHGFVHHTYREELKPTTYV